MSSTNAILPEKSAGVHLSLEPGYSGAIRARAAVPGHWRRAIVIMYEKKTRRIISSTTFVEYAAGKMSLETSGESVWRYSARNVPTALNIRIEDKRSGEYKPSRTIRPVTARKEPEDTNKGDFYLSAILGDDILDDKGTEDFNFEDGIVTVLQYK
ncbi:hypothetical protein PLEOSDRAFT_1071836 [Pleurotus ostreatus PC15]|uniref:Uncharacterized protein n=1 Tax=Pleurotus ostreatus (strain PC15) TaxID=1137138 RepID=A0A067NM91_PLEO1|nr:hypothetical protein PLEOSDRAFT_1071836 [Pleurotus ostreatus PC15]